MVGRCVLEEDLGLVRIQIGTWIALGGVAPGGTPPLTESEPPTRVNPDG
jgi:hypothetical protein